MFDLKKSTTSSWNEYIIEFETLWTAVNTKTSTADQNSKQWICGLKQAFTDEEFKVHILLRNLPSSLDNVVDNLRTKDTISYSDMRTQILELQRIDSSSSFALVATSK